MSFNECKCRKEAIFSFWETEGINLDDIITPARLSSGRSDKSKSLWLFLYLFLNKNVDALLRNTQWQFVTNISNTHLM